MARRVEDLALLFGVLAGGDLSAASRGTIRGWRVAWYVDDGVAPVTKETSRAVEAAASALESGGLIVEHVRPPGVELGYDLWLRMFSRASVVELRELYEGYEHEGGAFVSWRLATADNTPLPTLDEYLHSWRQRDRLRAKLLHWMKETPLIVAPVGATPALKHEVNKVTVEGKTFGAFRAFSYSQAFNVFDFPAVSIPAGRSVEGLPIGVQIVGRPFAEQSVLAAAAIVEETLGGWQPPPLH